MHLPRDPIHTSMRYEQKSGRRVMSVISGRLAPPASHLPIGPLSPESTEMVTYVQILVPWKGPFESIGIGGLNKDVRVVWIELGYSPAQMSGTAKLGVCRGRGGRRCGYGGRPLIGSYIFVSRTTWFSLLDQAPGNPDTPPLDLEACWIRAWGQKMLSRCQPCR